MIYFKSRLNSYVCRLIDSSAHALSSIFYKKLFFHRNNGFVIFVFSQWISLDTLRTSLYTWEATFSTFKYFD